MRKSVLEKYVKLSLGILFWGCIFASLSHAESEIKLWKSQTVYVPIYSHIFLGGTERMPLNLSANLIIRNTDSVNLIHITEINYYNSEGELIKSYLNSPKELKPMASTYFLIQTSDKSGGWGANFIVEWKSAKKVTEPLFEAIHSGVMGTHSYSFASRGKAIKGVYASGVGPHAK